VPPDAGHQPKRTCTLSQETKLGNFSDANPTLFVSCGYFGFARAICGEQWSPVRTSKLRRRPPSSAGHYAMHGVCRFEFQPTITLFVNQPEVFTITNPLCRWQVTSVKPTIHIGETQPFVAFGTPAWIEKICARSAELLGQRQLYANRKCPGRLRRSEWPTLCD